VAVLARAIRADSNVPAVFIVAGYPIDDPELTELAPGSWPRDE
jgi:hypothetical protein